MPVPVGGNGIEIAIDALMLAERNVEIKRRRIQGSEPVDSLIRCFVVSLIRCFVVSLIR